jgi:hypothetical protein
MLATGPELNGPGFQVKVIMPGEDTWMLVLVPTQTVIEVGLNEITGKGFTVT